MTRNLSTDDAAARDFLDTQTKIANDRWEGFAQAVLNIAKNWDHGHQLGRLMPGLSAADYLTANVALKDRRIIVPLLTESTLSHRQIATVAGVSHQTVGRIAAATGPDGPVEGRLGADGKVRRRRREVGVDIPDEKWAARRLRRAALGQWAREELARDWDEGRCVGRFFEGLDVDEVIEQKAAERRRRDGDVVEWVVAA